MVCFFYIDLSGREALQCLSSIKRILTLIASLEKNKFFKKRCVPSCCFVFFLNQECSILSAQSHFIMAKRTTVVFQDRYSIIPTPIAVPEEIYGERELVVVAAHGLRKV